MRRRRLGSSGLRVSRLGLGTFTWGTLIDEETCRDLLVAYVEAGGSLLDTAHAYGVGTAERMLGSLIGDVVAREDVTICTKAGITRRGEARVEDTSRGALLDQLDQSLRHLGTDHLDLWLVHLWDDDTSLDETMSALEYAVSSGRTRYVGVSNYSGWQSARAFSLLESARIPLVANEIEYSLVRRDPEDEVVPAARSLGFGLLPWSPLGGGVLTGKYRSGVPSGSRATLSQYRASFADYLTERNLTIADAVCTAAAGLGVTPTEVALAWVRDRPGVTAPIVGAKTPPQLRAALASEDLDLPTALVEALEEVSD
ncbi:aldo/keto reductase [Lapillicoccus sp.]|uniref:aldo/keto reductase n=1 Tax=Lapillicoccus sp. TaxID=1909287 RepID=UPI003264ADE1